MTQTLEYGRNDANAYSAYYKFSGRTSARSLFLGALAGVPIAVACGVAYALIDRYVPFVKLMFLATMGFGFAAGFATTEVMRRFRLRSPAVAMAVVGVVTFIGYYASWVTWEYLLLPPNVKVWRLATRPDAVARIAVLVYKSGTWSLSSHDPNPVYGWPLGLVWLLEAASVFGFALVVAWGRIRQFPFCESCQSWCTRRADFGSSADVGDPAELRRRLEDRDFEFPRTLRPASGEVGRPFLVYQHEACPKCETFHTLTVIRTSLHYDKRQKKLVRGKCTTLIPRLIISPEEAAAIRPAQVPVAVAPATPPLPTGIVTGD